MVCVVAFHCILHLFCVWRCNSLSSSLIGWQVHPLLSSMRIFPKRPSSLCVTHAGSPKYQVGVVCATAGVPVGSCYVVCWSMFAGWIVSVVWLIHVFLEKGISVKGTAYMCTR